MSVSSSWHRTGDAAGGYGRWSHLFLCGVWIQGAWPPCPAIFTTRLAVPRRWEQLFVYFDHKAPVTVTLFLSSLIYSIKTINRRRLVHKLQWQTQQMRVYFSNVALQKLSLKSRFRITIAFSHSFLLHLLLIWLLHPALHYLSSATVAALLCWLICNVVCVSSPLSAYRFFKERLQAVELFWYFAALQGVFRAQSVHRGCSDVGGNLLC